MRNAPFGSLMRAAATGDRGRSPVAASDELAGAVPDTWNRLGAIWVFVTDTNRPDGRATLLQTAASSSLEGRGVVPGDRYTIDASVRHDGYVGEREARTFLPFLLPHLCRGLSIVDVGCGVGAITLDLAASVEPARIVGIDRGPSRSRSRAPRRRSAG
jgi:hypothetical protein